MKKIMFSDIFGLNEAVLSGRKTMTRRVIKGDYIKIVHLEHEGSFIGITADGESVILPQPAYNVGEEVAIAQAYQTLRWPSLPGIDWEAITDEVTHSKGWTNKMFVKAKYMPHRIRITKTKLERLQDISEEDCLREGIVKTDCVAPYGFPVGNGKWKNYRTPQDAFAALIDRINGRGTWQDNPWVVAYTMELQRAEGFNEQETK